MTLTAATELVKSQYKIRQQIAMLEALRQAATGPGAMEVLTSLEIEDELMTVSSDVYLVLSEVVWIERECKCQRFCFWLNEERRSDWQ